MIYPASKSLLLFAGVAGLLTIASAESTAAQQLYNGYSMAESQPQQYGQQPLLFGVAAYKICELKSFLFAAVYVLSSIAFVIFAVRALFTKFEIKQFIPIIGSIFIVASADLFIAWMATDAFYCPTTLSMMSND
eukprot:GHVR01064940.1.p1 GENE.GHVR01064940.1~~GHVR01064940.1.p1  ORF type:complete len:134 (+),score=5.78 GHVR01064940.1:3-404(+)